MLIVDPCKGIHYNFITPIVLCTTFFARNCNSFHFFGSKNVKFHVGSILNLENGSFFIGLQCSIEDWNSKRIILIKIVFQSRFIEDKRIISSCTLEWFAFELTFVVLLPCISFHGKKNSLLKNSTFICIKIKVIVSW